MYELIFTPVDMIMAVLGGMALGFVIGASIMKWTMKVHHEVTRDLPQTSEEIIRELLKFPKRDDGGEAFHDECGDR